jgi:hypothetical protein
MTINERYEGTAEFTTNILKNGCAVRCKICPQQLLVREYKPDENVIHLSLENFKIILNKIPKTYRIDFSGYAEPFLNKDCGKMIEYARDAGYDVCCYTTLVGASNEDVDILSTLSYSPICPLEIHLPDRGGVMPTKVTDKYRAILEYLISKEIPSITFMTMDRTGEVHPDLKDLVGQLGSFFIWSRADNVENVYDGGRVNGEIICRAMPKLNHNVILPNGDVQLCCMDYGLRHTLGNLITDDHESLFKSEEFIRVKELMENDSGESEEEILCRFCELALPVVKH